jgi:hypothetical protein
MVGALEVGVEGGQSCNYNVFSVIQGDRAGSNGAKMAI